MYLPTSLTLFLVVLAPAAVFAAPAEDHKGGPPPSGLPPLPSGVSFPGGPHGTGIPPPPPPSGGGPRSHHGPKPTGTDFPPPPSGLPPSSL